MYTHHFENLKKVYALELITMINNGLDPTLFDEEYFNSETLQMSEPESAEMNILPCEVSQIVPISINHDVSVKRAITGP